MGYIEGADREQQVLFPELLDDYVTADNPVRFIDAFVTSLDLVALGFQRAVPSSTGRPAYDPGDLLRLYIYGYLHRLRSSRRLEQETHRNVELMWLLRKLTPDFKTIADFRRDNTRGLKAVCREFTLVCKALEQKIDALRARRERYTSLLAQLEASGETQLSLTDPESRGMKVRGGTEACYNVQTAVDAKHKLIVANDVTNAPTAREALSPMASAAQAVLGAKGLDVIADMGYYSGPEVVACMEAGIRPTVPRPRTSANTKHGLFTKDDFTYDAARDEYRCPAGETLTYRFSTVEGGRGMRYYSTGACGHCELKARCTRNQASRRITRWEQEAVLDAMEQRLRENPELGTRRKAIVEHPFGTMKRGMSQGYFLLRGLAKVRAEFSLTVLAYNLRRVINIVGIPRLMAAFT